MSFLTEFPYKVEVPEHKKITEKLLVILIIEREKSKTFLDSHQPIDCGFTMV